MRECRFNKEAARLPRAGGSFINIGGLNGAIRTPSMREVDGFGLEQPRRFESNRCWQRLYAWRLSVLIPEPCHGKTDWLARRGAAFKETFFLPPLGAGLAETFVGSPFQACFRAPAPGPVPGPFFQGASRLGFGSGFESAGRPVGRLTRPASALGLLSALPAHLGL
jgi:hypothetical protein